MEQSQIGVLGKKITHNVRDVKNMMGRPTLGLSSHAFNSNLICQNDIQWYLSAIRENIVVKLESSQRMHS